MANYFLSVALATSMICDVDFKTILIFICIFICFVWIIFSIALTYFILNN